MVFYHYLEKYLVYRNPQVRVDLLELTLDAGVCHNFSSLLRLWSGIINISNRICPNVPNTLGINSWCRCYLDSVGPFENVAHAMKHYWLFADTYQLPWWLPMDTFVNKANSLPKRPSMNLRNKHIDEGVSRCFILKVKIQYLTEMPRSPNDPPKLGACHVTWGYPEVRTLSPWRSLAFRTAGE